MKFHRILFPVDFSDYSQKLNGQVEWLAQRFNSKVTLLHVFEIPSSWYGGADAPMLSGEDIVAFANDERQRLQEYSIHIPESRLERVSLEGGAAWHIANWTKEHDTDQQWNESAKDRIRKSNKKFAVYNKDDRSNDYAANDPLKLFAGIDRCAAARSIEWAQTISIDRRVNRGPAYQHEHEIDQHCQPVYITRKFLVVPHCLLMSSRDRHIFSQ